MCCDNAESDLPEDHECEECGAPVDKYGDALDICNWSKELCEKCGSAPCDQSC